MCKPLASNCNPGGGMNCKGWNGVPLKFEAVLGAVVSGRDCSRNGDLDLFRVC